MNYTQWLTKLIDVICSNADLETDQIALTESDCIEQYEKGLTPEQMYFDYWQQDAGNFWAI